MDYIGFTAPDRARLQAALGAEGRPPQPGPLANET